jgi:DNA-binding transcriptional regulator PaaX
LIKSIYRIKNEKNITLRLLESLKDFTLDSVELWGVFFSLGYGASLNKVQYELLKKQPGTKNMKSLSKISKDDFNKSRNKFYAMVSNLQKDGLLEVSKKEEKKYFKITKKGKEKLLILKNKEINKLPSKSYKKIKNNNLIIVMFDIPESEKRKRVWLRSALIILGFKMIQKSVWMAKVKIPKDFLIDLTNIRIINFVEVFEISKTGSLKSI